MKRLKLIPLFLTLIFLVSCSLGKKYLLLEKPATNTTTEQNIEDGTQANRGDTGSHFLAGIEKLQNQDYKEAVKEFKKALVVDTHNTDIYYYLALAEQKRGHLDDAAEGYRATLKNNPEIYEAIFNLAVVYSLQRKYNLAMEKYYEGLNISPDDPELHYNMALCFDQMGKINKAVSEYQKAIQLDSKMIDPYLQLAALYERQGKVPEAIHEYQKALKVDPDREIAQKKLAMLSVSGKKAAEEGEASPAESAKAEAEPKEGTFGKVARISQASLARVISYPKKLYQYIGGNDEKSKANEGAADGVITKNFRLSLDNKLVTQKKVTFENSSGDNAINSKRSIAKLGYVPGFLKNTQVYVNLGSVSMAFDEDVKTGPFERAMAFAYGLGISSDVYSLPEYPMGFKVNLDLLKYSSKADNSDAHASATAELTEYQLAADTVYRGFSKFSPYLGLLYAKASGSLEFSSDTTENFDEKNQIGCRIGTGYSLRENLGLTAEYRLIDESALSLLVNYVF